jgi:hypothetical protein
MRSKTMILLVALTLVAVALPSSARATLECVFNCEAASAQCQFTSQSEFQECLAGENPGPVFLEFFSGACLESLSGDRLGCRNSLSECLRDCRPASPSCSNTTSRPTA